MVRLLLATILYGVVLFGSQVLVVAAREEDPRLSATKHVTFVQNCIQRRSQMIGNLIRDTGSLPNGKYAEAIAELKRNMTVDLSMTRLVVNDIITDPSLNVTFNETKCRSFYMDHEKTERDVDKNLDDHVSVALNATLTRLEKAKDAADAALEQVGHLIPEAASCYQRKCFTIRNTADAIRADFFARFSELTCADKSPSKRMELILRMALDLFEQKGQLVILRTWECIYNGHPPPIPHRHRNHNFRHHYYQPDQQA